MFKNVMFEKEMESYLLNNGYDVADKNGVIDSSKVVDEAIGLGFNSYLLDGDGEFNQTLIFILE